MKHLLLIICMCLLWIDVLVMQSINGGWGKQMVVACINRMRRNKSASDVM